MLIVAGGIVIFATQNLAETEGVGWNSDEFWAGMSTFANQIRHDGLVILFVLPLVFGLFMVSKRSRYANSIMIMIAGMLVIVPLISGFTDMTNQPYRFVPLVFFFAIGVGTLLSKR
jgi:MFS superfamily sulfate permease-like transporter